jgi:hypothetical protein
MEHLAVEKRRAPRWRRHDARAHCSAQARRSKERVLDGEVVRLLRLGVVAVGGETCEYAAGLLSPQCPPPAL